MFHLDLLGIGSKEDVVVHLGCNSEVGLTFEAGLVTFKNCTILVNNKQSGISVKVVLASLGKMFDLSKKLNMKIDISDDR